MKKKTNDKYAVVQYREYMGGVDMEPVVFGVHDTQEEANQHVKTLMIEQAKYISENFLAEEPTGKVTIEVDFDEFHIDCKYARNPDAPFLYRWVVSPIIK